MGARSWMLVYAAGDAAEALARSPALDRDATEAFARALFSRSRLMALEDGSLLDTAPDDNEICVACFPGVSIVAAEEFGIERPSELPKRFVSAGGKGTVTLHAMHSAVDWFAFAQWRNGGLVRALSLSPDSGVVEDIGPRMSFEKPYWSGQHPAVDDEDAESYPLPFHPLELGEAALLELVGYTIEGVVESWRFDPESIPLMRFERSRPRWKFW